MNFEKAVKDYIDSHKKEIVDTLKELVRIPSVRGQSQSGAPFGSECARVLEFSEELYRKNGFATELDQNGGYLLSFYGEGKRSIGIFAHADVVPAGDGWIYTDPFEPLEKNGCIIGRGTIDDKSAVLISLYCAKMLKELKIPFHSRLVMFTGGAEESGMDDIKNYLRGHTPPDFSIVADSAFPLYRGNKGRLVFTLKSKNRLSRGIRISGGTGASVIGRATAVLPFSQPLLDELTEIQNDKISVAFKENKIEITAEGIPKHSALPEGAVSGLALLSGALCTLKTVDENDKTVLKQLKEMSESFFGEYFGITNTDPEFGKLTCVLTKIKMDEYGEVTVDYNIRYGTAIKRETIFAKIEEKSAQTGWGKPKFGDFSEPHALPADHQMIAALLETYSEFTGEKNPTAHINAGGTYRQYLKNAAEIGPTLIWDAGFDLPKGHGGVHQPDEFINIEGLLKAMELTALMLIKLDKKLSEDK